MVGILDVGGGMRGVYTAGIYDYLLDNGIDINYCLGVSAGSANLITYIAGQRGRLRRFYLEYAFEKEYMSAGNYLKKGMYIDLDYIYSGITDSPGKDPLDYNAIMKSEKTFVAVTTEAETGTPRYFSKYDMSFNDFTLMKAGCAIPVACRRPIFFKGENHFDGGVADPIPYKKAFDDGCDRLIVCLTLPLDYEKSAMPERLVSALLKKYPEIAKKVISSHTDYKKRVEEIMRLEAEDRVLILAPPDCFGVKTATRNREGLEKLYQAGYRDAEKIEEFLSL